MRTTTILLQLAGICLICLAIGCTPQPENSTIVENKDSLSIANDAPASSSMAAEPAIAPQDSFETQFVFLDLFKSENSDVVNTIVDENHAAAAKKCASYLSDPQGSLTVTQKANLRYMHIYAVAGLVAQGKKTHQDIQKLMESYQNQPLVVQLLEITQGNHMPFNQIQVEQEQPHTIEVTCTNDAGFNIHCFVRVAMKTDVDLKKNVGKSAYLCGKLKDFKISDNAVVSWIVDMNLVDGFVKILEDRPETSH